MSFSFKYKSVILESGKRIYRPLIPIEFLGKEEWLSFISILDTGSDISIKKTMCHHTLKCVV